MTYSGLVVVSLSGLTQQLCRLSIKGIKPLLKVLKAISIMIIIAHPSHTESLRNHTLLRSAPGILDQARGEHRSQMVQPHVLTRPGLSLICRLDVRRMTNRTAASPSRQRNLGARRRKTRCCCGTVHCIIVAGYLFLIMFASCC